MLFNGTSECHATAGSAAAYSFRHTIVKRESDMRLGLEELKDRAKVSGTRVS